MSRVTDVILTFSLGDGDALATVNRVIGDAIEQVFVLTSAHEPQEQVSGGRKALQGSIAMAAFNYISDDLLIEAVRSSAWKRPEKVHLFVQREQAEGGFTELSWRPNRGPFDDIWDLVAKCFAEAAAPGASERPEQSAEYEALRQLLDVMAALRERLRHEGFRPEEWDPADHVDIVAGLLLFNSDGPVAPGETVVLEAMAEIGGEPAFPSSQTLARPMHFATVPPASEMWMLQSIRVGANEQMVPPPAQRDLTPLAPFVDIRFKMDTAMVGHRITITVINASDEARDFRCSMVARFPVDKAATVLQ